MGKKDFTNINVGRVYDTIAEATAEPDSEQPPRSEQGPQDPGNQDSKKPYADRKTYTDREAIDYMLQMKTSGRKGVKLPRINVAFAPDNYAYVKTMAQVRGETLTEFINHVIKLSMEENEEIYKKAIEFRNSF